MDNINRTDNVNSGADIEICLICNHPLLETDLCYVCDQGFLHKKCNFPRQEKFICGDAVHIIPIDVNISSEEGLLTAKKIYSDLKKDINNGFGKRHCDLCEIPGVKPTKCKLRVSYLSDTFLDKKDKKKDNKKDKNRPISKEIEEAIKEEKLEDYLLESKKFFENGSLLGWNDVIGHDKIKERLQEFHRHRRAMERAGKEYHKNILHEGPPRSGKGTVVMAMCGEELKHETDIVIFLRGMDIISGDLKESALLIKRNFDIARTIRDRTGKSVHFILDEAERKAPSRKSSSHNQAILSSAWLESVDGFTETKKIYTHFIVNEIIGFDAAMIAPGRISKRFHYNLPDKESRIKAIDRFICHNPGLILSDEEKDEYAIFLEGQSVAFIKDVGKDLDGYIEDGKVVTIELLYAKTDMSIQTYNSTIEDTNTAEDTKVQCPLCGSDEKIVKRGGSRRKCNICNKWFDINVQYKDGKPIRKQNEYEDNDIKTFTYPSIEEMLDFCLYYCGVKFKDDYVKIKKYFGLYGKLDNKKLDRLKTGYRELNKQLEAQDEPKKEEFKEELKDECMKNIMDKRLVLDTVAGLVSTD